MTILADPGMVPRAGSSRKNASADAIVASGLRERLREVPLAWKVLGAGLPVVLVTFAVGLFAARNGPVSPLTVTVIALAEAATIGISAALVLVALRPLHDLQTALERFGAGDASARVADAAWADEELRNVGRTLNAVFDALQRDRDRARELAENVLLESDEERIRLADELYDSSAQSMTALLLELRAVSALVPDDATLERLESMRRIGSGVLNEIRELSEAAHPKVLSARGLNATLEQMIRTAARGESLRTSYDGDVALDTLRPGAAALVYRVVQTALRHAEMGRAPRTVHVQADANSVVQVTVIDDGPPYQEGQENDASYASLRRRAELTGGSLVRSVQGHRRTLLLGLPLRPAPGGAVTNT